MSFMNLFFRFSDLLRFSYGKIPLKFRFLWRNLSWNIQWMLATLAHETFLGYFQPLWGFIFMTLFTTKTVFQGLQDRNNCSGRTIKFSWAPKKHEPFFETKQPRVAYQGNNGWGLRQNDESRRRHASYASAS